MGICYSGSMATKVVDPQMPTSIITRAVDELPSLPQEEARRLRRAVRSAVDVALPQLYSRLIQIALNTEDEKLAADLGIRLMKFSLKEKSNEELDPDPTHTVDGEVVKDAVAKLEEETENVGDGKGT